MIWKRWRKRKIVDSKLHWKGSMFPGWREEWARLKCNEVYWSLWLSSFATEGIFFSALPSKTFVQTSHSRRIHMGKKKSFKLQSRIHFCFRWVDVRFDLFERIRHACVPIPTEPFEWLDKTLHPTQPTNRNIKYTSELRFVVVFVSSDKLIILSARVCVCSHLHVIKGNAMGWVWMFWLDTNLSAILQWNLRNQPSNDRCPFPLTPAWLSTQVSWWNRWNRLVGWWRGRIFIWIFAWKSVCIFHLFSLHLLNVNSSSFLFIFFIAKRLSWTKASKHDEEMFHLELMLSTLSPCTLFFTCWSLTGDTKRS